jgi:hypothetical protein
MIAAIALTALAGTAFGGAVRNNPGFTTNVLPGNDDGSTGLVPLGFNINFYGLNTNSGFVNNNGNMTFDAPLGTFTPFNLSTTNRQILAPFFADVDTRQANSGPVTYGQDTVGGQAAFGINWVHVGYFSLQNRHFNDFQLVVIDRSDIAAGDFDFEFNYDTIDWETGQASGGDVEGRGGNSARVGWSNGATDTFELAGSAINGAFLDGAGGANELITHSLNSNVAGRYLFSVRSGVVTPSAPLPLASGMGLATIGLLAARRRR